LADLTRTATGLRYRNVGGSSYPNPAIRGKLVYPMSGNLMFFEKINEDNCLFLYGA
jgi:hypothetical protein